MYEKFSNIRLDLFKIHDSKDNTKNWILCKGENLKIELKRLISKTNFSNTELVKHLMKKLNISIASAGQSPLNALHRALYKAFGYKVDSHVIDGPLEDSEKKKIESELTLIISRDGRSHVAQERFPWDQERDGLYDATIAVYLKILREQKI